MSAGLASMAEAVQLHQAGRLDEAERAYRAILAREPKQADAQHLLGVIALQRGDARAAIALIGRALELAPGHPQYLGNLATAHLEAGEAPAAIALYRKALMRAPNHVEARYNLGNALRMTGDFAGAAECYRAVAARAPGHLQARNNQALCLAELGRIDEAIAVMDAALAAGPDHAPSHHNLARLLQRAGRTQEAIARYDEAVRRAPGDPDTLNARGTALAEAGRAAEAERDYRHAQALDARNVDAHINLGNLRRNAGALAEAEREYREALALDARSAAAQGNLALTLSAANRHDEALAAIEGAIALRPDHADSHKSRGSILIAAGRPEEALAALDRALALDPRHPDALFARAIAALSVGRFGQGWRDYQARAAVRAAADRFHRAPLPADLTSRHVVIERDQGLGDELFFLRFAPAVAARGARTTYLTDARLVAMLQRAGVASHVLAQDADPGPGEFRVAVGDLPCLLGTGDEAPPPGPFAVPPLPERSAALMRRLADFAPPPYLGVTWRAGTRGAVGATFKEAPMAELARIAGGARGALVALQRGPEGGEVEAFAAAAGRPVLDLTALNADLEDMLALMALLDDYVAVSNTNVHLRAAAGRPCRVLVPNPPEFRWMARGDRSPWFPGTHIYRQATDGSWRAAFATLAGDLAASAQG